MSNPAERKPGYSDPLLILVAALLLVAVVATMFFSTSRPHQEFAKELPVRPRPILTNDTRVLVVTKEVAKAGAGHAAAEATKPAEEAKPAEVKPAEKSAAPAEVTVAAPVVKAGADGKIRGKVVLKGTPPPERPIAAVKSDVNCGKVLTGPAPTTRSYVAAADGGLRYVLVRVLNAPAGGSPAGEAPLIDQHVCMYEPYVSAVMAGQTFKVRNSDAFMHNVNATPKINKGFNFAQASAGAVNEKAFDKPELGIRFSCNVHPWMTATVHVLEHPFFALTNDKGEFELPTGLPAGKYTVEFNHAKAGVVTAEVEVAAGKGAEIAVELGVK